MTWLALDFVRQAALQDMCFNLGQAGLAKFSHMLAAVRASNWSVAYQEALASKWAEQVHKRAADDANIAPHRRVARVKWLCPCGYRNWQHNLFCAKCGENKPK